jgi:hypothetical protein
VNSNDAITVTTLHTAGGADGLTGANLVVRCNVVYGRVDEWGDFWEAQSFPLTPTSADAPGQTVTHTGKVLDNIHLRGKFEMYVACAAPRIVGDRFDPTNARDTVQVPQRIGTAERERIRFVIDSGFLVSNMFPPSGTTTTLNEDNSPLLDFTIELYDDDVANTQGLVCGVTYSGPLATPGSPLMSDSALMAQGNGGVALDNGGYLYEAQINTTALPLVPGRYSFSASCLSATPAQTSEQNSGAGHFTVTRGHEAGVLEVRKGTCFVLFVLFVCFVLLFARVFLSYCTAAHNTTLTPYYRVIPFVSTL